MSILEKLYAVLLERKNADPDKSYVASLYAEGAPKISEKILEEAAEMTDELTRLEKTPGDASAREALKNETADLLFHAMVALAHNDIPPDEIFEILEKRFGTGGYAEKASREK